MYYKIQYFDPKLLTWKDIQKSYTTIELAVAAFPKGKKCRVMAIAGKKRYIVFATE